MKALGEGGAKTFVLIFLAHFPGWHTVPHVTYPLALTSHTALSYLIIFQDSRRDCRAQFESEVVE